MTKYLRRYLTFKRMLKVLQFFFAKAPTTECRKLWDVLAGLRGPDNQDTLNFSGNLQVTSMKLATTAVIRKRFLNLGANRAGSFAVTNNDSRDYALIRTSLVKGSVVAPEHFIKHAKKAFAALGLKWDYSNND